MPLQIEVVFNETNQSLPVNFGKGKQSLPVSFKNFQQVTLKPDVEFYKGEYDVTPRVDEQSLKTKDRYMTEDVHIKAIPYAEVQNLANGTTVTIA